MRYLVLGLVVLGAFLLAGCASTSTEEVTYDDTSWETMIGAECQSFFDGCNQCMRVDDAVACTKMFCETYMEPYCTDEVVESEVSNDDSDDGLMDRETEMEIQREDANQYAPEFIGLTVEQAQDFAMEHDMMFRIVEQDGESLAITMDLRPGRINATVEDNIVVSVDVE